MAREQKQFSWRRVLVLLLLVLSGAMLCSNLFPGHHPSRGDPCLVGCMNNLRQLGALMSERLAEDRLQRVPGAVFLKQFAADLRNEDLQTFTCPGDPRYPPADDLHWRWPWLVENLEDLVKRYADDWRTAPCSYRGPDADLLAEAFGPYAPRLIIACDQNGPDGSAPYHAGGVVVLYNDARVGFIKWEKMEGYAGGPVKVGPGSPDPRFRRLIP